MKRSSGLDPLANDKFSATNTLAKAFSFLQIDKDKFEQIATKELKLQYLNYKYLKAEMAYVRSLGEIGEIDVAAKELVNAKNAYEVLLESRSIKNHKSTLSKHSKGLQYLNYFQETDEPYLLVKEFTSGVEPKYIACSEEEILFSIQNDFPDLESRLQFIKNYPQIKNCLPDLKKETNLYLVKFDYKNIDEKSLTVMGDIENILKTNTLTKAGNKLRGYLGKRVGDFAIKRTAEVWQMKTTKTSNDRSTEAVIENLANDLHAAAGCNTQEQHLYSAFYKIGKKPIKIMPVGKWNANAKPLTLGGDITHKETGKVFGVNNICIEPVLLPQDNITSISQSSFKMAHLLFIYILFADYDALGSQGQNKMQVPNTNGELAALFGIDHGHLLSKDILPLVMANMHLSKHDVFKNFSVFYDAPRSEIIKGLLILYKLSERSISEDILEGYDPEFKTLLNKIESNSLHAILNDYLSTFLQKQVETVDGYNQNGYKNILETVKEINSKISENLLKITDRFEHYANLMPYEIDLIDNIEKVAHGKDGTTLRSPDGHTLLNNLSIKEYSIQKLDIQKSDTEIHLNFTFKNAQAAILAQQNLAKWKRNGQASTLFSIKKLDDNQLILTANLENIPLLISAFDQTKIKERFHPNDHELQTQYFYARKLTELCEDFPFINVALTANNDSGYKLSFAAQNKSIDPMILASVREHFYLDDNQALEFFISTEIGDLRKTISDLQDMTVKINDQLSAEKKEIQDLMSSLNPGHQISILEIKSASDQKHVAKIEDSTSYWINFKNPDGLRKDASDSIQKVLLPFLQTDEQYKIPYSDSYKISNVLKEIILTEKFDTFVSKYKGNILDELKSCHLTITQDGKVNFKTTSENPQFLNTLMNSQFSKYLNDSVPFNKADDLLANFEIALQSQLIKTGRKQFSLFAKNHSEQPIAEKLDIQAKTMIEVPSSDNSEQTPVNDKTNVTPKFH